MKKYYLLTPGPTPVPPEAGVKASLPIIHHRTPAFKELLVQVTEELKYVFQTQNDLFILSASGTGGMEAGLANLFSPGDKVLVLNAGAFGRRWGEMTKKFGLLADILEYPWGKVPPVEDIERKLKAEPQIKGVFTQLTETSTGIVVDIEKIAKVVGKTGAVLVVDAVSGLAAQELRTDLWGVDVVVGASQKGLMVPPGLAFVSLSPKAWTLVEKSTLPKYYWDLLSYKKSLDKGGESPYTPAVSLMVQLKESLRMIKEEGLDNVFKRHRVLAAACRAGIKALNLAMFSEVPSDIVTAVKVPAGIDGSALVKTMRDKYGVSIAGGQREYKGKIFRIAHLGYMEKFDVIVALSCLEMVLSEMGYQLDFGKSVGEAEKVFVTEK